MKPSGVTAAQIVSGAYGDEVRINAAIALLGRMGGGTLDLDGIFPTADWIENLENNVSVLSSTSASIIPAIDFALPATTSVAFDFGFVMGRTGGALVTASIDGEGKLLIAFSENSAIGPNDAMYLATTSGATLPDGVDANTAYYLVDYTHSRSANVTTRLATTRGGTAISCSSVSGIGTLQLWYSWFYPANVNTGTSRITFPTGQRLSVNRPHMFRVNVGSISDFPAGLLARPNIFYPINEVAESGGAYSYQFSQSIGGSAVSISSAGTDGKVFTAIPCTTNQVLKNITIDCSALVTATSTIGAVQMQSSATNIFVQDCAVISPNCWALNARGTDMTISGNRITNTKGGIITSAMTSGLRATNNAFAGAAGNPDINLVAGCVYSVAVNNKLTTAGITNNGTSCTVSPNF